jgi:hypothetical protein
MNPPWGPCRRIWTSCWPTRFASPKHKASLPPALRNRLLQLAAFQNPEFYRAQSLRQTTFKTPRILSYAEDTWDHLGLPRGCLDELNHLLKTLKIKTEFRDERVRGMVLITQFLSELRPEQGAVGNALLAHDTGVLAATTAFGKTVVAA